MRFADLLKRRLFWADGKRPSNVIEWSPEDKTLLLRNVTTGVKKQADNESKALYSLMNLNGGGELVNIMKEASKKKDFSQLDRLLKEKVEPLLYNGGEGRKVPITELVLRRNRERPRHKQLNQAKNHRQDNGQSSDGGGVGGRISMWNISDMDHSLIDVNGDLVYSQKDAGKFRELCFNVDEIGNVGEGVIHMCLLNATPIHAEIAKRLIKIFPKMIDDIYLLDDYYGENALHMAIVNEDIAMVKFLLDNDIDYHQRCVGSFMSPEDQKSSRSDSLDHEWVDVNLNTNYEGYVYWGEYPLSFAACLGQEECYRLILAKGGSPDNQDTNGNTTLHMLAIYQKLDMFNMVYELGASTDIKNYQGLTPLTLAAKLAGKQVFSHMLKLQRVIYWQLGHITCAAYPLTEVDTISCHNGEINKNSALNLVVYGDKAGHLDMMEGLLIDLLNAKWNKFVKFRFYRQFLIFTIYFLISATCFILRPAPLDAHATQHYVCPSQRNLTNDLAIDLMDSNASNNSDVHGSCYLLKYCDHVDLVRMIFESLTLAGALLYILAAIREAWFLGYHIFLENLWTVPSRVLFLTSCTMMVILMLPARLTCSAQLEDVVAVLVMLTTSPYFLFFCRGFRMVGPFVVMIYKMIVTDLLCFVIIYVVFVLGFSQAYFILFASHHGDGYNYFRDPGESIMALFIMSLLKFDNIYAEFDNTDHPIVCKILFVMYMTMVSLLLINMLIAMMGKTYQMIAARRNEWIRQWARIVLVVERGVSPWERLKHQKRYSQPMSDGRRALVLRLCLNESEKQELTDLADMNMNRDENIRRLNKGARIL